MIPVPNLDDIAFDALVEQGRSLIPRFAPDWTDHNLHDPGITLLDLLAWIVDQQVYRIGSVGDAHLKAFAALLGVKPRPAQPASGLLWPGSGTRAHDQVLPAGTRACPAGQPQLVFRTAASARLGGAVLQPMSASAAGKRTAVWPDVTGGIRLDGATELLELTLASPLPALAGDESTLSVGLEFAAVLPGEERDLPPPIAFDYRSGDGLWYRPAIGWIDGGGRRSGAALLTIAAGDGVTAIRLGFAGFPIRALPTRLALDVLPLVQIETLDPVVLGESNGLPDLELPLGGGALPAPDGKGSPLRIQTKEDGRTVDWRQVDDLVSCGPDDSVFVVDEARATIRFGNGVNGRMPPARPGLPGQVNRCALDVTAGAKGNVAKGLEWKIEGLPAGGGAWTNREPATGGRDAWDRDALLTALRLRSRKRSALLTDSELRDAATQLEGFGVERAEVIQRFLPTLPRRPVPGARTLLLHPADGVEGSDSWVDSIERRLAPRRVLGERLSLAAAEPVEILVSAELLIAAGSDSPAVEKAVRAVLEARLSASRRCPQVDPWPSGRPVTIGELEALVAGVDGVVAVPRLELGRRGHPPAPVSVPLARTEVAVAAGEAIVLALRVEAGNG
jgi:Baseplate J-like protein